MDNNNKNNSIPNSSTLMFVIDLGGTSAKCAIADMQGQIIHKYFCKTDRKGEVIKNIYESLRQEMQKLDLDYERIEVIGFGCKGPFDKEKGQIVNAGALGWFNYPARDVAEKIFKRPVILTNDSRSATVGEWKRGAGRNYKNFICLTIGRGIGAGIVLNNELWEGAHNLAGEIGHGGLMQDKLMCDCGLPGCIEALSSARGIEWLMHQTANRKPNSTIAKLQENLGHPASIKELAELIKNHDAEVIEVLRQALSPLAQRISLAIFLLDVEAVIIGGGPSELGDDLIAPIVDTLKTCIWDKYLETVDLKVCELKNDAGIIGVIEYTLLNYQN